MMSKPSLYPLKFTPILKEKIWGGSKLNMLFNKQGDAALKLGESWELSGVEDAISIVAHGALKGKSLKDLIQLYGAALLGEKVVRQYGAKFPLLFKFIDATEDLSVQLHPDDALANERHNSFGKTEMWYILQAQTDARLLVGFNEGIDQGVYERHVSENKLLDIIKKEKVAKGDAFFIGPGTVHAIGAGTVLAEIQQTSDITYRIYDWDRPGLDGQLRDLHTAEAKEAIKFDTVKTRLSYTSAINEVSLICESNYFKTSKIVCKGTLQLDYSKLDSFKVYMCVAGTVFIYAANEEIELNQGDTLLIPACTHQVMITAQNGEILEVYIP